MFTVQLGILLGYVVLLYAVAFWSRRLDRGGVVGYFLAGRGLPPLVVGDLVKPSVRREMTPRAEQLLCRLTVLGVSAITLLLALRIASILKTLMIGLSLTTAYTLVVLATLYAPRFCRRSSAWVTLAAGIATLALWQLVPRVRLFSHPIYAEWLVCTAAFLLVPLFDRRRVAAAGPGITPEPARGSAAEPG
ncbi:MAG: hypothetical protein HY905_06495 [Deltaproteobacteria bacterium]|nr:hypothetical protein [Deltaproteobacteria bacterium]